jgi:hypothetical protein
VAHRQTRAEGDARRRLADGILFASVVLAVLICGGLLVYGSGRGLDLTDEVFYLGRTRDPTGYRLSYQPFGYLLHPLFQLTGGDLQTYRLAGFAIVAAAGAFLGSALPSADGRRRLCGLYGAVSALTVFFPWIITPSYNSAANAGAMLVIGGVLRTGSPRGRVAGGVAAAAGLAVAAFAKPPLFAIAVLGMAVVAVAARNRRAAIVASLVLAAGLISLVLPPVEIVALVRQIAVSQHVLGLPTTPSALPGKVGRDWLAVPWPLWVAAVAAGASLLLRPSPGSRWLGYAAVLASLGYVPSAAADLIGGYAPDFLGLALVTTAAGYAGVARGEQAGGRLALAVLLAAPAAVALGTFNNQWAQLNYSMVFPFLALFAVGLGDPARWRRRAVLALATLGPVGVMLFSAFHPYSLPASIFDQQVRITSPLTPGVLRVDPETATFVRSAHGLARGALLLDLSGTGPGVGVILGGRAPVLPWLNPATPTWPDVVWSGLSPEARESAAFVVPIWPTFQPSAPARWLAAHKARYCRTSLPPMTFWGQRRILELWRPCVKAAL